MEKIKILVCGDRKWTNEDYMEKVMRRSILLLWKKKGNSLIRNTYGYDPNMVTIVEGEAEGADKMAKKISIEKLGIPKENIKEYPAPWNDIIDKKSEQIGNRPDGSMYWKAAGHFRNTKMVEENPDLDLCIAFHSNINKSKGTKNMIDVCSRKNISYLIFGGE